MGQSLKSHGRQGRPEARNKSVARGSRLPSWAVGIQKQRVTPQTHRTACCRGGLGENGRLAAQQPGQKGSASPLPLHCRVNDPRPQATQQQQSPHPPSSLSFLSIPSKNWNRQQGSPPPLLKNWSQLQATSYMLIVPLVPTRYLGKIPNSSLSPGLASHRIHNDRRKNTESSFCIHK